MRKIYVDKWLGLKFSDLPIEISPYKLADTGFYENFYRNFFQQVQSFEDIYDATYLEYKEEVIDHLLNLISTNTKILSIGCGLGYIEKRLAETTNIKSIVAIEPAISAIQWIDKSNIKLLHGFFPDILEDKWSVEDFVFVYASGIDYVFNNEQYEIFLKSVVNFGIKDLLLTEIFVPNEDYFSLSKDFLKEILIRLGLFNPGQLWFFLRSIDEHKFFLKNSGFNHITYGKYKHGSFWIRGTV